ncbi:MAG TPA: archease [Thermoplasmata archaeon]|nr:archease [Thermoplasmata archaeon]
MSGNKDNSFTSGYRFIEHTADIGLHSRGKSLEESLANLGKGMTDIISDLRKVEEKIEESISVEAESIEELVIAYLCEILFLFDTKHLLFSNFKIKLEYKNGIYCLHATMKGEVFDPKKHSYPVEIKAVTEHLLEVKKEPPFDIKVIFDL